MKSDCSGDFVTVIAYVHFDLEVVSVDGVWFSVAARVRKVEMMAWLELEVMDQVFVEAADS